MAEQKEVSIGALWLKSGGKGDYFTGSLELDGKDGEKIRVVAFKNDHKTSDKQPDYKIFRAREREKVTAPAYAPAYPGHDFEPPF